MLGQMAGYDPLDIFSVQSAPVDYVKEMHQSVKGFRLGTPVSFYDHVEPDIEKAVRAALEVLIGLTAGVPPARRCGTVFPAMVSATPTSIIMTS